MALAAWSSSTWSSPSSDQGPSGHGQPALPVRAPARSTGTVTTTYGGWRVATGVVAGLNAVAALGGAAGLVTGTLSLEELTTRLPFGSATLAGIALGLLVAVPQAVLTVLAVRRSTATAAASVVVGAAMVGWILLETAFLRVVSGLQVGYAIVGLLQVALGLALAHRETGRWSVRADWWPWRSARATRPPSRA